MTVVLPLISRLAEGNSVDEVWGLAAGFFAELGFSRANYGYTRFLHRSNVGDPHDAIFLSTGSPEYVRFYFQDGFYARTPVYRWAMANVGACTWKWVREAYQAGKLTEEEADAVRQNAALGIRSGISISFPEGSSRSKGALGLLADPEIDEDQVETIWQDRRDEVLAVAHMLHLKIITLPQAAAKRSLTMRQREALEWMADGKTAQDVALLMGVSPAMVEKHLRLAREALAVETTTQAVAKASFLNLIFRSEVKSPVVGKS